MASHIQKHTMKVRMHAKQKSMEGAFCVILHHSWAVSCHHFTPTVINCVGSWGDCTVTCGGGTQTYAVTTAAANGGTDCQAADASTQACSVQDCPGGAGSTGVVRAALHCTAELSLDAVGCYRWMAAQEVSRICQGLQSHLSLLPERVWGDGVHISQRTQHGTLIRNRHAHTRTRTHTHTRACHGEHPNYGAIIANTT